MLIASIASFGESLQHLLGFFLVVFVLSLLWILTLLMGRIFRGIDRALSPATDGAGISAALSDADEDDPTEEEVAAVAAAVMALVGRPSRIVSIRSGGKDWGMEGRRDHFASHRLR